MELIRQCDVLHLVLIWWTWTWQSSQAWSSSKNCFRRKEVYSPNLNFWPLDLVPEIIKKFETAQLQKKNVVLFNIKFNSNGLGARGIKRKKSMGRNRKYFTVLFLVIFSNKSFYNFTKSSTALKTTKIRLCETFKLQGNLNHKLLFVKAFIEVEDQENSRKSLSP